MQRFYANMDFCIGARYTLPEEVVRHMHVLRLRSGEHIYLFNGDGCNYLGRITTMTKRDIVISIEDKLAVNNESKLHLTILISLIANDKFEFALQKAIELGVNEIIPVVSAKTQRIKAERQQHKFDHWQKIIISAAEQCGRARLAQIKPVMPLSEAVELVASEAKFILSPHHFSASATDIKPQSAALLVGPEGGFTEEELLMVNKTGFLNLNLGQRILRAETAAIAGLCYLHSHYGDFN